MTTLPWFWRAELLFVLFILLMGVFLVKLTGSFVVPTVLCLSVYLLRHLFYINRLLSWLRFGKASHLPAGDGIWEEIYYLIFRIRKRNRHRKKLLLKMLERFRTSTAALPDATIVLGSRDQIEWFNEAAERLLGIRRGDIGQNIGNLLRSPKFTRYLRQGDYRNTVSILSPVVDRIQLDVRIVPYGDDLRLLVAQDVTQLRFMERVRSDFIANVSHELRTPLTVLRGYVETLNDAGDRMPGNYQQMFVRMEEQTSRMQNLVEGLLSLTRLESVSPGVHDPVDVPAMLESICADARLLDGHGPALSLILDTPDGLLGSDPELHSAFSNLIFNAVKYTPAPGEVTVHWFRDSNEKIRLDVSDTGPGIAPEHLPRLTERFYRVNQETGKNHTGSGLGLAIVKHVLSRHGSELEITSTLGQGSRFSCAFASSRISPTDRLAG